MILMHERRPACRHLIDKDSKSPPVNCETMPFLIKDLWSQILCGSAEGVGLLCLGLQEFRQAKVGQIDVASFINEYVLRLKISVDYAVMVKIAKCYSNLCSIEFHNVLREALVMEQMVIEITTSHILKEKVDSELVLKYIIHTKHEGMLRLEQDLFFILGILYLLFVNQYILINSLHGIEISIVLVDNQKHLPKRAFIYHLFYLEIF